MIWAKGAHQSANFQTFDCSSEFRQICTLIGSFCWKYIQFQLKRHRGVMSHVTEEWCKLLRKANFLFQKWQKSGEFWSENSKVSKICTLIGPFCAKYITFDLKKYRGVIFHDTEESCKIWRKTDLCDLENGIRNLADFHENNWKSQNLGLWWDPFIQRGNVWV